MDVGRSQKDHNWFLLFTAAVLFALSSCSGEPEDNTNPNPIFDTSLDSTTAIEKRDSLLGTIEWGALDDSLDEFTGYREISSKELRPIVVEQGPEDGAAVFTRASYTLDPQLEEFFILSVLSTRDPRKTAALECQNDIGYLQDAHLLVDGERMQPDSQVDDFLERSHILFCARVFAFDDSAEFNQFRKIAYADTVRMRTGKYTLALPHRSRLDMRNIWKRVR